MTTTTIKEPRKFRHGYGTKCSIKFMKNEKIITLNGRIKQDVFKVTLRDEFGKITIPNEHIIELTINDDD